jgi:uncharacterized protein (DUF983 family)
MAKKVPSLLASIFQNKCPRCRKGQMYTNKSILPLKQMMDMPEECPVCGQKMELHTGFYFGTGYVSYALSVAVVVAIFVIYSLFFKFSFNDNSPYFFLLYAVIALVLLQPWIMRLSRVMFLYLFVKRDKTL